MSQNNYCIVFAIFAAMVQQVAAQDQVGESAPTALDSRNSVIDNLLFLDTTHMFISITGNLWC